MVSRFYFYSFGNNFLQIHYFVTSEFQLLSDLASFQLKKTTFIMQWKLSLICLQCQEWREKEGQPGIHQE